MLKKILVPIDGSKSSNHSVKAAIDLGEKFGSDILILTVIPEVTIFEQYPSNFPYSTEINKANTERAELVLNEVDELLEGYPYNTSSFYTTGNPSSEIEKFAEEHDVDLIVMGNRGLGAFSRTLLGSVSNKVINQAKVSVLVIKSDFEIGDEEVIE